MARRMQTSNFQQYNKNIKFINLEEEVLQSEDEPNNSRSLDKSLDHDEKILTLMRNRKKRRHERNKSAADSATFTIRELHDG